MAPTLLGRHVEAHCGACGVFWPAFAAFPPGESVVAKCWNCGASVTLDDAEVRPGTTVRLLARADTTAFSIGELVAVQLPREEATTVDHSGTVAARGAVQAVAPSGERLSLSVKRIVALPGQVVTQHSGQLLVNGEPILPERIWLPVHDDSYRNAGQSWWQPDSEDAAQTIRRTPSGFRLRGAADDADRRADAPSGWLVYHHRSVHQALQPDRVRDDVPSNVTEVRSLLPVSRLRLSLRIAVTTPGWLEVAFWDAATITVQRFALAPGTRSLEIIGPPRGVEAAAPAAGAHERPLGANRPALSAQRPLALRLSAGEADITQLRIDRPLEYRIDPRLAATIGWPVRLAADEYYLLGDNVPLSIDSRHFGPVAGARIVGRIAPVRYDRPRQ